VWPKKEWHMARMGGKRTAAGSKASVTLTHSLAHSLTSPKDKQETLVALWQPRGKC